MEETSIEAYLTRKLNFWVTVTDMSRGRRGSRDGGAGGGCSGNGSGDDTRFLHIGKTEEIGA